MKHSRKKHNNEFKEKRRNHMKGNTINIDRVHIHKDGVNKNVKQNDLQKYLNSGWSLGWNINTCEKIKRLWTKYYSK